MPNIILLISMKTRIRRRPNSHGRPYEKTSRIQSHAFKRPLAYDRVIESIHIFCVFLEIYALFWTIVIFRSYCLFDYTFVYTSLIFFFTIVWIIKLYNPLKLYLYSFYTYISVFTLSLSPIPFDTHVFSWTIILHRYIVLLYIYSPICFLRILNVYEMYIYAHCVYKCLIVYKLYNLRSATVKKNAYIFQKSQKTWIFSIYTTRVNVTYPAKPVAV